MKYLKLDRLFVLSIVLVVSLFYCNRHLILRPNVGFVPVEGCPATLPGMTVGYWATRPLTDDEERDITTFTTHSSTRYRFPKSYQRSDGQCGNVTHVGSNYRALCDSKGSTPCCYKNRCAAKSVTGCVCKDCYDMRNQKHAEYSNWIPSNSKCRYKAHNMAEACMILKDMNIMFVGDSLVRHIYTALLLVVNGNMESGAIQKNTAKNIKKRCRGMYMFTEKQCRLHLDMNARVCVGSVNLGMRRLYNSGFVSDIKSTAFKMPPKSLLFLGLGVRDDFSYTRVQNNLLIPTLREISKRNTSWPRLLWHNHHAPGLLKSPRYLAQSYDNTNKFNLHMNAFCRERNVPVFDTFNMTDGMMSFDGEHYGLGINVVKANIFLSYIQELRQRGKW